MASIKEANLMIESLKEYDYAPYNFISKMDEFEPGKFRIKHFDNKVPLLYSLTCLKS